MRIGAWINRTLNTSYYKRKFFKIKWFLSILRKKTLFFDFYRKKTVFHCSFYRYAGDVKNWSVDCRFSITIDQLRLFIGNKNFWVENNSGYGFSLKIKVPIKWLKRGNQLIRLQQRLIELLLLCLLFKFLILVRLSVNFERIFTYRRVMQVRYNHRFKYHCR